MIGAFTLFFIKNIFYCTIKRSLIILKNRTSLLSAKITCKDFYLFIKTCKYLFLIFDIPPWTPLEVHDYVTAAFYKYTFKAWGEVGGPSRDVQRGVSTRWIQKCGEGEGEKGEYEPWSWEEKNLEKKKRTSQK